MLLNEFTVIQLQQRLELLKHKYTEFKTENLKLDMSRGRPCTEQLELSNGMLAFPRVSNDFMLANGTDARNYGAVDGIPEAKTLFAEMLEVSPTEIILGGNSSLSMMYDTVARAMFFGVYGSQTPWGKLAEVKFICPCPGYDRHFAITECFGIQMINVPMTPVGPDMDAVERLVASDESIKGIWCVPKYSNPDGITYSDEVVLRMARMRTKASDFRIFWDNAYAVHHLTDVHDRLLNIMAACKAAGNADRVFEFSSTSKITFAGGGIAIMAASENNCQRIVKQLSVQTITPDKINQLRHVHFLKSVEGITAHMRRHAAILKPKFDQVLSILDRDLGDKGIASWNSPRGGYFISLDTLPGCASQSIALAREAGVIFTPAGATFPYGKDPEDRNIRIAPTLPPVAELEKAMALLTVCIELTGISKILANRQQAG